MFGYAGFGPFGYRYVDGGVAFSDPTSIDGLVLWLDASDATTITDTAGAVNQWDDKSANAYAFTQTLTARPTTGTTTINSKNVLVFDGNDRLVVTGTRAPWVFLHDGSPYTVFVVNDPNAININQTLIATEDGTSTDGFRLLQLSATYDHTVRKSGGTSTVGNAATSSVVATPHLVSVVADVDNATAADRSALRVNGGAAVKNNASTVAPDAGSGSVPLSIGSRNGSLWYAGVIAEIVIYNTALSDANRELVEAYLMTKWGIS